MKAVLAVLILLSLAGNYLLYQSNESYKKQVFDLTAQVQSLTMEIEAAAQLKEDYNNIDQKYNDQIRKLQEQTAKLTDVLARTDFPSRATNAPEELESSMNKANKKWWERYNKVGSENNDS